MPLHSNQAAVYVHGCLIQRRDRQLLLMVQSALELYISFKDKDMVCKDMLKNDLVKVKVNHMNIRYMMVHVLLILKLLFCQYK